MNIKIMKSKSKHNSVNKNFYDEKVIEGHLIDSSLINPSITLARHTSADTFSDYNYCYIHQFKRTYYIDDIIYDKNTITLKLSVDVLTTYRKSILAGKYYLNKTSDSVNKYLADSTLAVPSNYVIKSYNFDTPLLNNGDKYVLNLMSN